MRHVSQIKLPCMKQQIKFPVVTQALGLLQHSGVGVIGEELNTGCLPKFCFIFMHLIIRYALCIKKKNS